MPVLLAAVAAALPTQLTVVWTSTAGERVVRGLSCEPPAAEACPQLAREDVSPPRPQRRLDARLPNIVDCSGPLRRWRVAVSGTWRGRPVAARFTCRASPAQLIRWARLSGFNRLGGRRHGPPANPVWSPDGSKIAFTDDFAIWVANADGSGAYRVLPGLDAFEQLEWAPSPRLVVVANYTVLSLHPDGRDLRALANGRSVALAPDGRRVAFQEAGDCGRCRGRVGTVGIAGGRPAYVPTGRWLTDRDPTLTRDGRLAFHRFSIEDAPHPVASGVYVGRPGGRPRLVRRAAFLPAWSPDGARIAVADETGVARSTWHTMRPDGRDVRLLADGRSPTQPVWSPTGQALLITRAVERRVYLYVTTPLGSRPRRVATRPLAFGACWTLVNGTCTTHLHSWSPSGDEILFVTPDAGCRSRSLAVVSVASGAWRRLVRTC